MGELQGGTRRSRGDSPPATLGALQHNGYIYIAFTLKRNTKRYPLTQDYDDYIENNINHHRGVEVIMYHYELDSKRRLHIHGTIFCPKNFYRKQFTRSGWHMKMTEISSYEDLYRWTEYCEKDFNGEEQEFKMCCEYDDMVKSDPFGSGDYFKRADASIEDTQSEFFAYFFIK